MCPLRSWYIQWVREGLHGWEEDILWYFRPYIGHSWNAQLTRFARVHYLDYLEILLGVRSVCQTKWCQVIVERTLRRPRIKHQHHCTPLRTGHHKIFVFRLLLTPRVNYYH